MNSILIINLGRMGDLLQTTPMITFLKERHRETRIGLLAASNFKETVQGMPDVDMAHLLDLTDYMLPLKSGGLKENYDRFTGLIEELKSHKYDKVFNLTHNRLGAALSSLICEDVTGLRLDKRGHQYVDNPWLSLFFNSNINRGLNQFNLVDLYRLAAGYEKKFRTAENSRLKFVVTPSDHAAAEKFFRENGVDPERKIIGIQAGASAEAKRWPEASFNVAAKRLAEEYTTVFFGSAKEREMVEKASREVKNAVNLCGKTGIGALAAVLQRCSLLISNDTGTQHLAATVGTPVLSLTMGPALASETGPCGEGNIVMEPDLECIPCSYTDNCQDTVCRRVISPDLIVWLAKRMVNGTDIEDIPAELSRNVRISRTGFDEEGLWELQPIKASRVGLRERVNIAYRKTWKELISSNNIKYIDDASLNGKEIAKELEGVLFHLQRLLEASLEGVEQSAVLKKLSRNPALDLTAIRNTGEKIAQIDRNIACVGENCRELRPVVWDFNLGKEALPEGELNIIAEKTEGLYRRLNMAVLLFKKYLITQYSDSIEPVSTPLVKTEKSAARVLTIDAPYFVTGEIIRGLKKAGAEVDIFGLDNSYKNNPQAGAIFIEKLVDQLRKNRSDFLLTVNHLGFDAEGFLLKELERLEIKSAVYYVDSPLFILDEPEKLVSDLSVIFSWDDYYLGRLKAYGFRNLIYLPLGTDETVFRPRDKGQIPLEYQPEIGYAADSLNLRAAEHSGYLTAEMNSAAAAEKISAAVSVNGKAIPEILEEAAKDFKFSSAAQRRHFLAAWIMKVHQPQRLEVLQKLTPLGLKIFGDDEWKIHFPNGRPELSGRLKYYEQLPLLYAGTKIGFDSTSPQMPRGVNQRVFDIPAAGGFLLTDYREALTDIFDPEKDIAVYRTAEEAYDKAEFYLMRPELREKMALKARAKILAGHTYKHRAEFIIRKMSHPFNIDSDFLTEAKPAAGKSTAQRSGFPTDSLTEAFPETIDIPRELCRHIYTDKHLTIAPERAAWVVTDKTGAEIIDRLHSGDSIGRTAAFLADEYGYSSAEALLKVKELIELCNKQNFRESFDTARLDIDKRARNLQLFLTRRCNLNCRHCYFSAGEPMENELTTEQWKSVIRKFARLGAGSLVTLTGGEPMMRKDFWEIAQEAVDQGLKLALLSNGGLIRDAVIAGRIADMFDIVQISLDGTTAEINDAVRGKGSFDNAVRAIRLLLAEKVEVEMTMVVLPENVQDLERNLAAFVQYLGGGKLRCALAVANPKGRLKGNLNTDAVSLAGRVLTAVGAQKWMRQGKFQPGCTIFGCELATSIVVNPDGKIGNCPYLNYSGPRSALEADFARLVSEDCAWHRGAMEKSAKCKVCDLRNFQCGGCQIFGKCGEQTKARNYYRMLEEK